MAEVDITVVPMMIWRWMMMVTMTMTMMMMMMMIMVEADLEPVLQRVKRQGKSPGNHSGQSANGNSTSQIYRPVFLLEL